ncbi:hypothetical protein D9613_012963 [Agrocybe pediades]|uniref:ABC transporter domain-containing protein n=1 Tax=Agrocybe pediades TaxID=84607 RepID=A0A8H4VPB6_9AGAR|nr:hypothetical protein D9613_012963 [Agrocybe pediades]
MSGMNGKAGSTDDLNSMARLEKITDRSASVVLSSCTLSFYGRPIVEGAEIPLNHGQRCGSLGENGSGKPTFLQSIAKRGIAFPEHIVIYLVRGEAKLSEVNAVDFIIASAKAKVARLEACIEEPSMADDVDEQALEMAYEELEEMDPDGPIDFRSQGRQNSPRSRIHPGYNAEPTKDMSGGWRMCVALARALFIKSHLLLDKHTNHMDLDFINTVCAKILDLTHKKKLNYYAGNDSAYIKTKQENGVNQMKTHLKQQDGNAHIKKFIVSAGTYTNLTEAAGLVEKVETGKRLRFNFEDVQKFPPPIIAFDNVAFSYSGKKEDYLYEKVSYGIEMDSRVAILGTNGTGKSTLLHLITGALQPCERTISKHAALLEARQVLAALGRPAPIRQVAHSIYSIYL